MSKELKDRGLGIPFERIRRITGYLSLTTSFCTAKQKELEDRIKHGGGK